MGNYYFTNFEDGELKVEFSIVLTKKILMNNLKIILHDSHLSISEINERLKERIDFLRKELAKITIIRIMF